MSAAIDTRGRGKATVAGRAGDPLISMRGICKVFPPGIVAEDHVNLDVSGGTIHSIVGENGAGKSTLMKILYGLIPRDEGQILVNSEQVEFASPRDALAHGIGMVHQEFMLIPSYNVYENVILGSEPVGPLGRINWQAARKSVDRLIRDFDFSLTPETPIRELSVAAQQKVEILKLLYRGVNTLILDEPTAVLTPQEIRELFQRLKQFKESGKTIIFISHKLDEILQISDIITIMRGGRVVSTVPNEGVTESDLATRMVGRQVVFSVPKDTARPGEPVLTVHDLTVRNSMGRPAVKRVSFSVRRGEIVGVAGVEGNGQKELVEAIVGLRAHDSGDIRLRSRDLTALSIAGRRRAGMAFVPQDRKGVGGALAASLEDNCLMGHHLGGSLVRRGGVLDLTRIRAFTKTVLDRFSVVSGGPQAVFGSLSGGNQQKLILGRELSLDASLLILDQPTRGLDVGSIEFVHRTIVAARDAGAAILMVSADLDEVLTLSDRILVMYGGEIVAELDPGKTSREEVGIYMLGGAQAS